MHRQLLAVSIDVAVRIMVESSADISRILNSGALSLENLNLQLESDGLEPISTFVFQPVASSSNTDFSPEIITEQSYSGLNPLALVGVGMAVIVVSSPCIFLLA